MPTLRITRDEGGFRWDAYSILLSTIMVPDEQGLRREYEAALKLETTGGLPGGKSLLGKRDLVLAKNFDRRPRIEQIMSTRRLHVKLAGVMLWDLHTAAVAHSEIATKNKIQFTIDRISAAAGTEGSRAILRKVWRQFRPVIHWCAAMAYHSRVFGRLLLQDPEIGYVGDVVLTDFLTLGNAFLTFARKSVEFPDGATSSFWTAPKFTPAEPRRSEWPDAHIILPGIMMDPEFVKTAAGYVAETMGIMRDPIVGGVARRFSLGKAAPKNS